MNLTKEIISYIDRSVLCWLATASANNLPNVSPKEIFNSYGTDEIIIANIVSPKTVKNIKQNENICVSFIDILVQKGFQIHGKAEIIEKSNPEFQERERVLTKMTGGKFPFDSITKITVEHTKPIIAPKYLIYPETTEEQQIECAKCAYGLNNSSGNSN